MCYHIELHILHKFIYSFLVFCELYILAKRNCVTPLKLCFLTPFGRVWLYVYLLPVGGVFVSTAYAFNSYFLPFARYFSLVQMQKS